MKAILFYLAAFLFLSTLNFGVHWFYAWDYPSHWTPDCKQDFGIFEIFALSFPLPFTTVFDPKK